MHQVLDGAAVQSAEILKWSLHSALRGLWSVFEATIHCVPGSHLTGI